MTDDQPVAELLCELTDKLNLLPATDESVFGEIGGNPVTMTVLGGNPLALLFAFKLAPPDTDGADPLDKFLYSGGESKINVSFEDGFVWLSLYELSSESSDSIAETIEEFGGKLQEAGLTIASGCVSCGDQENFNTVYLEGKASRLCPNCVEQVYEKRRTAEEALNSASAFHRFGLPLVVVLVTTGWMVFWFLCDMTFEVTGINFIEINRFVVVVLMALLLIGGLGLGYPIGVFVRKSGAAPSLMQLQSVGLVLLAGFGGEVLYIAICIYRQAGMFDISGAFQVFVPFIKSYHVLWLVNKVLLAAAISFGALIAATGRKTAQVRN